jgi:hypothetical protein
VSFQVENSRGALMCAQSLLAMLVYYCLLCFCSIEGFDDPSMGWARYAQFFKHFNLNRWGGALAG